MFIRWKETNRPLTREQEAKIAPLRPAWVVGKKDPLSHRFYAYLAESKRIEGKPRQKIITYLASIPAWAMQEPTSDEWRLFWYSAVASLCRAGVSKDAFFDALRGLELRVQRPAARELIDIVGEEYKHHPKWHKNYEATASTIDRIDYYAQWFAW